MENNNDNIIMSKYAFERMQAKDERNDLWRNRIILILIILLVLTNAMWLWAWNQYDYVDTEDSYSVDIDSGEGGDANYIGNDGEINYGSNYSNAEEENQNENQ